MFPQSGITHPLNKGPVARRRCFPRTLARCSLSREGSVRVGGKNVHTTNQCTLQGAAAPTPTTAAYLFPQLATDVTEPLHTVEAHRLQSAVAQHFRDLCVLLLILLEDQFALLRLVLVLTATTVFTSLSLVLRHGYRAMWLVIASRKRTAETKSSTEGGDFHTALLLRDRGRGKCGNIGFPRKKGEETSYQSAAVTAWMTEKKPRRFFFLFCNCAHGRVGTRPSSS